MHISMTNKKTATKVCTLCYNNHHHLVDKGYWYCPKGITSSDQWLIVFSPTVFANSTLSPQMSWLTLATDQFTSKKCRSVVGVRHIQHPHASRDQCHHHTISAVEVEPISVVQSIVIGQRPQDKDQWIDAYSVIGAPVSLNILYPSISIPDRGTAQSLGINRIAQ